MNIEQEVPGEARDWTASGIFEVSPEVYRVVLPLPLDALKAVNVYIVGPPDHLTVVDSGWNIPEARELLLEALGCLQATPRDIRRFLITHVHLDHYQQAVILRREFGMDVALGVDEVHTLDYILGDDFVPMSPQLARVRANGGAQVADEFAAEADFSDLGRIDIGYPSEWLTAGRVDVGRGREFEVVPTPGHTRGHVVFHDLAHELLFAGDHVLPTITPSIGFEPVPDKNPLGQFMSSLALVRSRPDAMLLPAHGPITASVHGRVDELVAHHGRRLDDTERCVRAGASSGADVAARLDWTRHGRRLDELSPFNQLLAINETVAHLDLLVAEGRVEFVKEPQPHYFVK